MKHLFLYLLLCCLGSLLVGQSITPYRHFVGVSPDTAAIQTFLSQKYPYAARPPFTLRRTAVRHSPGGQHWNFQQYLGDAPVRPGRIRVKISPEGYLTSVAGQVVNHHVPEIIRPEIELAAWRAQWQKSHPDLSTEVQLMYYAEERALKPCFVVEASSPYGNTHFEQLYDARSGELLATRDLNAYADTTGRGHVFDPNPCTAAAGTYGNPFYDRNDQHHPDFNPYLDTVSLRDLKYEGGFFHLDGPYVVLQDFAAPDSPLVKSVDGNFYFLRNQAGFEQVMAYYHIDTFQRYVQSLGYRLYDRPLRVDAHGSRADQSSFSTQGRISLGVGGVDDGEDADLIVHEYGHALAFDAAPGTRVGFERQSLEEGYCDYFSAAYSYDHNPFFGWDLVMNWDGHNEFWSGRSATVADLYSSNLRRYELAEVWASAMMEVRQKIGGQNADRLQLEILYGSFENMTFGDAYLLLREADSALFNGAYTLTLQDRFCARAIASGDDCEQVVGNGPAIPHGWEWWPAATTAGSVEIGYEGNLPDATRFGIWDARGRKIATILPGETVSGLAPGLYLVRPSGGYAAKKVWVR